MPPIRVLIADDHRFFAEALEAILTTDGRVLVAATARWRARARRDPDGHLDAGDG
jgi:DNA-binding NarL/FixJ family response regulator